MHLGKRVQEIFQDSGLSVVEFSRRINTSRENVYSIFNRSTLDVEMLVRISEVLNHNFFLEVMPDQFKREYLKELDQLRDRLQVLEEQTAYLKEIHDLRSRMDRDGSESA